MRKEIRYFKNPSLMYNVVAKAIKATAKTAVADSGNFSLALAGGKTPLPLYRKLAETNLPWAQMDFFWGDERCVPSDNEHSNYLNAFETLLSKVPVADNKIHRIPSELSAEAGARQYEQELMDFKHKNRRERLFDLVLLGMGEDGHTASLFPGSKLLDEREKLVAAAVAPSGVEPAGDRITLTYPALADSRFVFFMITGNNKRKLLESPKTFPAKLVEAEKVIWFVA